MLDSRLERGFQALQDHGLSLDILVQNWREIPLATLLAKHWPGLAIVLDHCGKPDVAGGRFDPWARHIEELASLTHVVCKLSGLLNCAGPGADPDGRGGLYQPGSKSVRSEQGHVGGDWPPLDLASDYATWKRISDVTLRVSDQISANRRHGGNGGARLSAEFLGLAT